jgi:hypothetical protein
MLQQLQLQGMLLLLRLDKQRQPQQLVHEQQPGWQDRRQATVMAAA